MIKKASELKPDMQIKLNVSVASIKLVGDEVTLKLRNTIQDCVFLVKFVLNENDEVEVIEEKNDEHTASKSV